MIFADGIMKSALAFNEIREKLIWRFFWCHGYRNQPRLGITSMSLYLTMELEYGIEIDFAIHDFNLLKRLPIWITEIANSQNQTQKWSVEMNLSARS